MIKLEGIKKRLGGMQVLEDLSFTVQPGEIVCLLGPSGCGKTTTLRMLAGLDEPDEGHIQGLDDIKISYAFQESRLLPWKSVEDNLHFVLKSQIELPERQALIERYLDLMGLGAYKKFYPEALSGGMKQRLSLCRAFAFPHQLLLMDEPFKSLDAPLRLSLVREVARMWEFSGSSIIFVTHDVAEALLLGHKLLVYSKRPTLVKAEFGIDIPHKDRELGDERLAHIYGQLMTALQKEY
ncbi:ABC transporter ATP-binding protein [Desulforamulus aquiferis]|uniref:ABC transporter ATP-binding protein n=1 Tax=Desulforamulus aquiferis TaxID=1397668 RepID=A0AAW7ZF81_9FIRM|nr:ABC transporter ATP-binding protein [Desulforamulus aquiferis]MDO7787686.1 ABC transporter ATP-binding protein [Desulforamulus aquiferis]